MVKKRVKSRVHFFFAWINLPFKEEQPWLFSLHHTTSTKNAKDGNITDFFGILPLISRGANSIHFFLIQRNKRDFDRMFSQK